MAEQAGLCLAWLETPEDTFWHDEAQCVTVPLSCSFDFTETQIRWVFDNLETIFHISPCCGNHLRLMLWVLMNTHKLCFYGELDNYLLIEPWHDKTNKMSVRPAKTQISLGIRPVWSESSLCAQWVAKDPNFLHADSEDWWSESSLGAHSLCWFCHVMAHINSLEKHNG